MSVWKLTDKESKGPSANNGGLFYFIPLQYIIELSPD